MDKKGLALEVEILTDSWFARGRLILRAKQRYNFSTITMARKDLVICKIPNTPKKKQVGRPRKYGQKIKPTLEELSHEIKLNIYGKEVTIKYKEAVAKPRFLKGEVIKAVWLTFDDSQSIRLLIATDTHLSAQEIIERYAKRWDIESMFNELKNRFRLKDIMMHSPRNYYQFLYFKIWCFIIIKLSSIQFQTKIIQYIKDFLPWRVHHKKGVTITAGSTKLALVGVFSTLHIRLFFPKVDKNINGDLEDNLFLGFDLDVGADIRGGFV